MNDQDTINADIEEIKEKLRSLGAPEENLDTIIEDVANVITSKALGLYIEHLADNSLKKSLKAMQAPEIVAYFEQHRQELPPISEEMLAEVAAATWADYFKAME